MSKLLWNRIEVKSEIYGVVGEIRDYGVVVKLFFSYQDKEIEIGLESPYPSKEEDWKKLGQKAMEFYISNLQEEKPKAMLFYWYIDYNESVKMLLAHGHVTGHSRLPDSYFIHTSEVKEVRLDKDAKEVLITTNNTTYHCPFSYCDFQKQEEEPEWIPEYAWLKEHYQGAAYEPVADDGEVLLVLSNFDDYYFHSLYYKEEGEEKQKEYRGHAHVGMFQDSFLISVEDTGMDLRYFPHFQNIEFYAQDTEGKRFFVENVGNAVLYVRTGGKCYQILPGKRKEIIPQNAEEEENYLPSGDLYPAGTLDQ